MIRVHDGLTPVALPMQAPQPIAPPPQNNRERRNNGNNVGQNVGRAVDGFLKELFGN